MQTNIDMEKYAENLYKAVKAKFPGNKVNSSNVFDLVRLSMEEVEKFRSLQGRQKKELVVRIIHEALKDYVIDDMESESLNFLVDNFIDLIIDQFCDINLGHLKINDDQKKTLRKIFPCCFPN